MIDGYDRSALVRLAQSASSSDQLFLSIASARDTAFYTVAIINAGNFIGRVIPAALSDVGVEPGFMVLGCTVSLAIVSFAWIAIKERAGYIAFLLIYGFFSGGIASLPGACLPYLCPSLDVFATRLGFIYFCAGLGVLIGTPIATAIDANLPADNGIWVVSCGWVRR